MFRCSGFLEHCKDLASGLFQGLGLRFFDIFDLDDWYRRAFLSAADLIFLELEGGILKGLTIWPAEKYRDPPPLSFPLGSSVFFLASSESLHPLVPAAERP